MKKAILQRLTLVDWRSLPAERVASLYAAEIDRWVSTLEWDSASDWDEVEQGRRLGTVSGVAVINDQGAIAGWSYYLVHGTTLQVGGFVAETDAAAELMLDAILADDVVEAVAGITFFVYDRAPGLGPALRRRGLTVDRYWYFCKPTRTAPSALAGSRRWRPEDAPATARLLASAYGAADESRPFAPRGAIDEWRDYVDQLTNATGCGALVPDASFCIPGGPSRLIGVVLVTRIAATTGHVAQLAIDPRSQGRRLGAELLDVAFSAAAAAGCRRVTLFVSGRNSRARRLYESARFEPMASFLAAGTLHPRRSTSVAPCGVIITRR